jgi:hypothetical protein
VVKRCFPAGDICSVGQIFPAFTKANVLSLVHNILSLAMISTLMMEALSSSKTVLDCMLSHLSTSS